MEIKNLSQLKKAIEARRTFVILEHYIKPEFTGQTRKPVVVQTNGFYSATVEDIEANKPLVNDGRGYWLHYGKASEWQFENGTCTFTVSSPYGKKPIWKIAFT